MKEEIKYVKRRLSFLVNTAETSYTKKFDLDKNIRIVKGLLMTSNNPALLFYRGSQKIELNGEELFPEGYESRLLMTGLNVPPDQKYADLGDGVLAGNGELKINYKDTENALGSFEAYEVSIYLMCELA